MPHTPASIDSPLTQTPAPAHTTQISKDSGDGRVSEEVCAAAVMMANSLGANAIFVYTRRGYMANFLSRWGTQGHAGRGVKVVVLVLLEA